MTKKNIITSQNTPNAAFLLRKNSYFRNKHKPAMELIQQFEEAVSESKALSERPSQGTMLELYSLYKQATIGDINIDPPANQFDFVAKAKYQSWSDLKGKSQADAMSAYIHLVSKLKNY